MAPAWRNFKNIFFTICTWPNRPVGAKILSGFQFEGKTDVWISQIRRVKYLLIYLEVLNLNFQSYLTLVFFSQAQQAHHDGIRGRSFLWLQLYLGLAWTVGCIFFGAVADNRWLHFWSFGPYWQLLFCIKN